MPSPRVTEYASSSRRSHECRQSHPLRLFTWYRRRIGRGLRTRNLPDRTVFPCQVTHHEVDCYSGRAQVHDESLGAKVEIGKALARINIDSQSTSMVQSRFVVFLRIDSVGVQSAGTQLHRANSGLHHLPRLCSHRTQKWTSELGVFVGMSIILAHAISCII